MMRLVARISPAAPGISCTIALDLIS